MKLSIIIINYHTKKYLNECLTSVFAQDTSFAYEVIVIDNDSEDLKDIKQLFPRIVLLTNTINIGFAAAANQGISISDTEYIMLLNPDVILEPGYLEKTVRVLEKNANIGSATGKLLHYDFEKKKKTGIIDSTGLVMHTTRQVTDRGQGEPDRHQFDGNITIWGVSAAAALYRRTALEIIKDEHGYFDVRFFMYKEDADVAWRLHNAKFKSMYVPTAIALHRRGTGISEQSNSFFNKLSQRKVSKSKEARILSFRNQQLMEAKNDTLGSRIRHAHIVYPYKLLKFIYYLIFERDTLFGTIKRHS